MVPYSAAAATGYLTAAGYPLEHEALGGSTGQGTLGTDLNIWGQYNWNQALTQQLVNPQISNPAY